MLVSTVLQAAYIEHYNEQRRNSFCCNTIEYAVELGLAHAIASDKHGSILLATKQNIFTELQQRLTHPLLILRHCYTSHSKQRDTDHSNEYK